MNKRGISHIEVLLSFLIFIGFVIFALYFFSPIKTSRLIESSLSYAFREIKENASIDIETYSVKLPDTQPIDTTSREISVMSVEIKGVDSNKNVRVEDYSGIEVNSERAGDIVNFELASFYQDQNIHLAIIKFSEDFDPSTQPQDDKTDTGYTIASSKTIRLISDKRITALANDYSSGEANYLKLKDSFNLPNGANFGFSLKFNDIEIKAERVIPEGVEVFSDVERVEVLRSNGEIEFADLAVRVW